MRARGLKHNDISIVRDELVAPHAGAWIETPDYVQRERLVTVAPHAGAWIETFNMFMFVVSLSSRPMRARGLKHIDISIVEC